MRLTTLSRIGLVLLVLAGTLFATPSQAGLINLTGATVVIATPPDVRVNIGLESNTAGFLFREATGIPLDASEAADITLPGVYGNGVPLTPGIVGPAVIDVYYFHFDPIGTTGGATITGSFTFDRNIVGMLVNESSLAGSNDVNPLTLYSMTGQAVDLGANGGDILTLSADRRTISYNFSAGPAADDFRFGVEAPEPGTLLLLGGGLLALARRRRNAAR